MQQLNFRKYGNSYMKSRKVCHGVLGISVVVVISVSIIRKYVFKLITCVFFSITFYKHSIVCLSVRCNCVNGISTDYLYVNSKLHTYIMYHCFEKDEKINFMYGL